MLRAINDYCNKIRLSVITVHIINSYINRNYTQTQEVKAITPRTERRVTANCANWPVLYLFHVFFEKDHDLPGFPYSLHSLKIYSMVVKGKLPSITTSGAFFKTFKCLFTCNKYQVDKFR